MEDKEIINLFLSRNESAITEFQNKYGKYCLKIAENILDNKEDAEECINDVNTLLWNKIPPVIPISLKTFTGKAIRDIALDKYRKNHAKKRNCALSIMLNELEECTPSSINIEEYFEQKELTEAIENWLKTLDKINRVAFIRRYYYCDTVKSISKLLNEKEQQTADRMRKLRNNLKNYLIKTEVIP